MKRRAPRARGAANDSRGSSGDDSRDGGRMMPTPNDEAAASSLLPPSDPSAGEPPSRSRKRRRDAGVDANHDNGGGNGGLEGGTSEAGATLFSAVMRRSGKTSPQKPASNATKPKTSIGTPQPKSQPSGGRIQRSPFSPGGYGLLRALDHANTSLYQEKRPDEDEDAAAEEREIEPEWYDAAVHFEKGSEGNDNSYDWGGRKRRNDLTEVLHAEKLNEGSGGGDDPIHASIVEATRHGVDFDNDDDAQPPATANGPDCPEPCGVGIMDWSLKNRMRLQCIPGRCLPGHDFLSLSQDADEGTVHRLALHCLSNGGSGVDVDGIDGIGRVCHERGNATAEEVAAAKWTAGTMYHQHPAVHPLPSSILQEANANTGNMDDLHNGGRPSSSWKGRINLSSCFRRVRLAGAGSMGGLGTSLPLVDGDAEAGMGGKRRHQRPLLATASSLWDQRRREWQEAFRSMHAAWRARLGTFGTHRGAPSPDALARCSFYAILPYRVVLFRAGHCANEKDGDGGVVPMVVLSSTSARLRSKLAAMGARLRLLTDIERGGVAHTFFSERLLDNAEKAQPNPGRAINDGDAAVHAELDAIKWADDEKGTVSVNLKRKGAGAKGGSGGGADVPPLYVAGRDDCAVVYELLLNTHGFAMDAEVEQSRAGGTLSAMPPADVPLLLCRSLGPCKHTSLRTLTVSRRRDGAHLRQGQDDGASRKPQPSADMASLELRGPILPCALRDLVCATVYRAMLDKRRTDRSDASRSRPRVDQLHDDGEGNASAAASSHQFIAFLQAHEGECPVVASKSTGSSSSLRFNGSNATVVPKGDASAGWNECSPGDSVHALVWDASRESVVSFNPASAKMA